MLNNDEMIPQYSTITFTDIWDDVDSFKEDLADSPFAGALSTSSPDNVSIVFYLLYHENEYLASAYRTGSGNKWIFCAFFYMEIDNILSS